MVTSSEVRRPVLSQRAVDMEHFLVFPLILLLLVSIGQSRMKTLQTYMLRDGRCPPGFRKNGAECQECEKGKYMDRTNTLDRCRPCTQCSLHYEVQISPCNTTSNVVCECIKGYYYKDRDCYTCGCSTCKALEENSDDPKRCPSCQREECLKDPECKRKCSVPSSTKTHTVSNPGPSNDTENPMWDPAVSFDYGYMRWMVFGVVALLFVMLLTMKCLGKPNWTCCRKDVELHADDLKVARSHQGGSLTTLTLHISGESCAKSLCQSPVARQHTDQTNPLLPQTKCEGDTGQKVPLHPGQVAIPGSQVEQSEHWPAIVLYAIINAVPLRRWKEFLRLLSVADQQLDRVELETGFGLGSTEKQYQMLRLWSQRSTASLKDVLSALDYMDLSGCAQLLQETLEKLKWRPEA